MNIKKIVIIIVCVILAAAAALLCWYGYSKDAETPSDIAAVESSDEFADDFNYSDNDDGTLCITAYNGGAVNVELPAKCDGKAVTSIGENAFRNDGSIMSVIIPESIKTINNCAFYNCSQLEYIEVEGEGLTTINDFAFYNCPMFSEMNLPSSVTSISEICFKKCDKLVISARLGSKAQNYAAAHNIECNTGEK